MPRRRVLSLGAAGALTAALSACGRGEAAAPDARTPGGLSPRPPTHRRSHPSQLTARPSAAARGALEPGTHTLGLGHDRDGLLHVPKRRRPGEAAPLIVMLHGAGGRAHHAIDFLRALADDAGLVVLAPDAREATWDVVAGDGFGPDIAFLDDALHALFERAAIDPAHVGVAGFSDGASYALSAGLANGELFTRVIAFSPGFVAAAPRRGKPHVYVSHGDDDRVLPIDRCSRRVVPALRRSGYDVKYREFDGPHTVPPEVALEAVGWFLEEAS